MIWLVLECRCHDRRQELPSGLDYVDEEVWTDKPEMRILLWKLFFPDVLEGTYLILFQHCEEAS